MKNGHNKGSSFERKICVALSKWWSDGESDSIFWRSAGSGARATTRHRKGMNTENGEGDIVYSDASGKLFTDAFCIELKCGYGDWSLTDFLETNQKETQFSKFWKQASESASNTLGAKPMLIYKRDRKNVMVVISYASFLMLSLIYGVGLSCLPHIELCQNNNKIVVFRFDELFSFMSSSIMKEFLEKENAKKPE